MKIVVLCGGLSPEREVSVSSGKMVAEALAHRGHEVALIDLCDDIPPDMPFGAAFKPKPRSGLSGREIGDGVIELCRRADAVFPAPTVRIYIFSSSPTMARIYSESVALPDA